MAKKKVLSEKEMRANLLKAGRELNCEQDIIQIFAYYDERLLGETDPVARHQIALEGIKTIELLLTGEPTPIEINGQMVKL